MEDRGPDFREAWAEAVAEADHAARVLAHRAVRLLDDRCSREHTEDGCCLSCCHCDRFWGEEEDWEAARAYRRALDKLEAMG